VNKNFSEGTLGVKLKLTFLIAIVVVLSACSSGNNADKVSLQQARIEHDAGRALLIDIRETREHQTGVAQGALLLPMSQLPQKQSLIPKDPSQPVLLICNTQNRSKASLAKLKEQGYQNIRYVEGGMSEWASKGWPMVAPSQP
jgi:rhodanese-related sulfurtransferase